MFYITCSNVLVEASFRYLYPAELKHQEGGELKPVFRVQVLANSWGVGTRIKRARQGR